MISSLSQALKSAAARQNSVQEIDRSPNSDSRRTRNAGAETQRHTSNQSKSTSQPPSSGTQLDTFTQTPTTADNLFRSRTELDKLRDESPWVTALDPVSEISPRTLPYLPVQSSPEGVRPQIFDPLTRDVWLPATGIGPTAYVPTGLPPNLPEADRPRPSPLEKLDRPDGSVIELAGEALDNGEISEALDQALNSEGDSVSLTLEVNVSALTPIGTAGVTEKITVKAQLVEDGGYEISLSREEAISLGLEISDDLNAQARVGVGVRVIYKFDTLDEATQGLKDLVVTAGDHPAIGHVTSVQEKSANVADNVINNPVTEAAGTIISRFPGFGGADDVLDVVQDGVSAVETGTDTINNVVDDAKGRLNDANTAIEFTGTVGADVNLGLPVTTEPGVEFGVKLSVDSTFRTRVNTDNTINVSVTYSGSGSAEIGGTGSIRLDAKASVTISQDYRRDGGDLDRVGKSQVTLSLDASETYTDGVVVSGSVGSGQRASYTFDAAELNGDVGEAIQLFLQGDTEGAIETLGNIEGDLTIQTRATGGAGFEIGASGVGGGLVVKGSLTAVDQGEAVHLDDLSLEEAYDLIEEYVPDVGVLLN